MHKLLGMSRNRVCKNPVSNGVFKKKPDILYRVFSGGVGGLSAKLVWCVESFFEGLAKYAFEASGSGSDI